MKTTPTDSPPTMPRLLRTNPVSKRQDEARPAFLTIALGGTGKEGARHVRELHDADGRPFPLYLVSIDTDPLVEDFFDRSILIALDGDKIGALKADPQTFGLVAQAIVEHYGPFLNPEDVRNGARMIRALTQLCFVYHRENILRQLREAILDLRRGNDSSRTPRPAFRWANADPCCRLCRPVRRSAVHYASRRRVKAFFSPASRPGRGARRRPRSVSAPRRRSRR